MIKFYKNKRTPESTIRVVSDESCTEKYGICGRIDDLLRYNILEYCDGPHSLYCFIGVNTNIDLFAESMQELKTLVREMITEP